MLYYRPVKHTVRRSTIELTRIYVSHTVHMSQLQYTESTRAM